MGKFLMLFFLVLTVFSFTNIVFAILNGHFELVSIMCLVTIINIALYNMVRLEVKMRKLNGIDK